MGRVVAHVHPRTVELADLIGGEESRLGGPAGDDKERPYHLKAPQSRKDADDVVDVAIVEREDDRLWGQRCPLVEGVEELGLVDGVVAGSAERRQLRGEIGRIDL